MDNGSHEKKKEIMRQLQQLLLPVVDALLWVNDKRGHQQTASKPLQQSISMYIEFQNRFFTKNKMNEQNSVKLY